MEHPLNIHTAPFSSPPDSPKEERDMEQGFKHAPTSPNNNAFLTPEVAYAGDFLSNALSSASGNDRDPLLLKSKLQSEESITELRRRKSGKSRKNLGSFYSRQNAQIESLLKSMDDHIQDFAEEEDSNRSAIRIAIWGSLAANICLAILQIYAAVSSLSLSFFATAIDAVFDPMANLVLNYCHRKAKTVDLQKYPSGGSKFETIGDIVYSGVMGSVSVILVAFAIQNLAKGAPEEDATLHIPAIVAVGIAFVTKLTLFLYCYSIRSKNSQVRVLWEDHRNDLFINGFGLFTSTAGVKVVWFLDPLGALIISVVLIAVWGSTIYGHFTFLAGKAAPIEFQQLVIYKAMTFAEGIEKIDSCVVYHAGPDYVVEVDIVMSSETPLWKAHDISQALQDKLEELPRVDREPAGPPPSELGRYRLLSPTCSLRVSPLCLGGMNLGSGWNAILGEMTKQSSFKMLDTFYEAGGNFIDTANNYQAEESEQIIGEWMETNGNRDEMVIATKYTASTGYKKDAKIQVNYQGNGVKSMVVSVDASLKKLRTHYIDILYVHFWDYTTSIAELMNGLNNLVKSGKVLYLGISDTPAWIVSQANQYAKDHGMSQFVIYQGRWSVASRDLEREVIPMCRAHGMALAPWGTIGGGKFQTKKDLDLRAKGGETLRQLSGSGQTEDEEKISAALEKVGKELGTESVTAVALAYALQKHPYVFPIIGGRKVEQLLGNIESLTLTLTPGQIEFLESVLPFELGFPMNYFGTDPHTNGGKHSRFLESVAAYSWVEAEQAIKPTK